MQMNQENKVNVSLEEDAAGKELVVCDLGTRQIRLSPQEARILATQLVVAVNRAEVRINLKHGHKLSRKRMT
ncbi:MAG TPA: hypothetical protein VEP67_05860 [Thiobacillaceae bacterium]|nr:hypothetical protein [Thiobacillaceae bacterium]